MPTSGPKQPTKKLKTKSGMPTATNDLDKHHHQHYNDRMSTGEKLMVCRGEKASCGYMWKPRKDKPKRCPKCLRWQVYEEKKLEKPK